MPFLSWILGKKSPDHRTSDDSATSDSSQGHSQRSSQSSSNSSSTGTDSGTSDHNDSEELKRLQRSKRTEKARQTAIVNKALRKKQREQGQNCTLPEHPADAFRHDVHLDSTRLLVPGIQTLLRKHRLRLLWSWFVSLTGSIWTFLRSQHGRMRHVLNVCVVDDTNMRLASPEDPSRRSRVASCMNVVQTLLFNVKKDPSESDDRREDDTLRRSYLLHTPLVPLDRTNAKGLAAELTSWLFLWLDGIGERFLKFMPEARPDKSCCDIPIKGLNICWDSLKTNMAVLKGLGTAAYVQWQSSAMSGRIHPLFSSRCSLHQIALVRKQLLFFFDEHWSTLVRLAHLFETQSFRTQFHRALLKVISASFQFIPVACLPADACNWKEDRCRKVGLLQDCRSHGAIRLAAHSRLAELDNSDINSTQVLHWCIGPNCPCGGDRKKALVEMCKLYSQLFSTGYPVPLTYRWVHAHRALQFCKETWNKCQA